MAAITLTNDFHNTSVTLRVGEAEKLTAHQVRKARRALCGSKSCTCSGDLGTRGPQKFRVEQTGPESFVYAPYID